MKRKRGPTKCKDIWALSRGEKFHIRVNTQGQPVGKNVKKLTTFLGTLARNGAYAPLRYEDWRKMPNYYKTEMWDLVQEKFDIDPFVEPWISSSLSSKWRNFKSSVKRDWFQCKERDERVSDDDWAWLLRYWSTDKALKKEVVGKENRGRVLSAHTLGSKSYACKRDEMAESRPDKSEPTRAEVYVAAHVRPNGTPLNDKVAKVIERINEKKTQIEPSHHDSPGPHDILSQALGEDKYHHSRTFGLGSGWGVKNSRVSILKKALEAKRNAEENAEKMKGELQEVRAGQGKIMTLLHKLHPNVSIDELLDSTTQVRLFFLI
ncbi:unnamed protein product [Linum tenue]|uniref:Transposase n=2 Tax=Linum tenue TaxID=586396 RepID=A0AAV0IWN0_9ROSI|nr:unnamed protein product [Linum tenue]